ncbi:nSTAND1 domain-containing NTPase [Lentzea terrae]|uniref:nSTAND1 domain-containing NTPase n=1 Tax=Lentzea terrae TaxID=2200761 RepID=UPI0018E57105|nr:XRE family transcriptional regulator [Lentzea terrae]
MPRGERPLDEGDSPLLLFAADLRQLRTNVGRPSYRELSRRAHFSASTLSDAAGGRKLPGLDVTLAYVRACHGDESAWERRWHELAVAMAQSKAADGPSPYVGLNPFTTEDADRFFGREALTHTLLDRLDRQRFLAVFGASGEGKSSLLRAGIAAKFPDAVICTPGHDPDAAIAEALDRNPGLLVVDQFEELFTLCEDEVQRSAFLDALLSADCRRVVAIRSDFYPHCAQYPKLADALTDAQVLLGTMTPDELRRAITQPAATVGCTVETALLTTLVAEAAGRSGVLPLVSHALLETWHRRRGNTLTLTGYQAAGGIQGALAQSAEAAFATLDEEQQRLAKQLLLRLSADGTKRPIPRQDVVGEEVLNVLADTRLITVDEDTVEVTHEALFRAWPRLRAWLDEDREGLRTHRRLTDAARTWQELGRDNDSLYRTSRLAETTEWLDRAQPELTSTEREFIGASRARERRRSRRVRWIAAGLTALLVATTATAVVAVQQRREVDRLGLVRKSQELTELSEALIGTDPERAALAALEAYRTYPTVEARGRVLSAAAAASRGGEISVEGAGRVLRHNNAWSMGLVGSELWLMSPDGLDIYDAASLRHSRTVRLTTGSSYVFSWSLTKDGRLAVSENNGRVTVRARPDAEPVEFAKAPQPVGVRFSEDGGSLLVGGTVFDSATRQKRYELPAPITGPFSVRDERTLALTAGGSVAVWDMVTRRQIGGFALGSGTVLRVTLLPGSKLVAITTDEGVVQVRDIATGAVVATPHGHAGPITSLGLSPDETVLLSGGQDGKVHMWDLARGAELATLRVGEPVFSLNYAPDGALAILTEHSLRFWPPASLPKPSGRAVRALTVDTDGTVLTVDDAGVIERRDSDLRSVDRRETGVAQNWKSRFSPDRKLLVTSTPFAVREVATGRVVTNMATLGFTGGQVVALEFSGHSVLAIGGETPDGVWPVAEGAQPTLIGGMSWGQRTSAAFGRSDHEIVLGRDDGGVSARNIKTWEEKALQSPHRRPVRALALSPDRTLLATGDDSGLIALWDTATWRQIGELRDHTQAVTALEFSPDNSRLASGGRDREVIVWDMGARTSWATLRGHSQPITHLAWRPDGSAVVSAGADAMTVWPLDVDEAMRKIG